MANSDGHEVDWPDFCAGQVLVRSHSGKKGSTLATLSGCQNALQPQPGLEPTSSAESPISQALAAAALTVTAGFALVQSDTNAH